MIETKLSLEEFQIKGKAAGFRFICPSCGNVASPKDFQAVGADPQMAPTNCIGRTMHPMPKPRKGKTPCDWAAFGLLGNLGKGLTVVLEDGKEIETFALAEPLSAEPKHSALPV